MNENIKRLLERLWQEWEPVTMCGVLLPGGDQEITLTIRRITPETAQNGQQGEVYSS